MSKYQFTIDPDEINDSYKENMQTKRSVIDIINEHVTDEPLKQLCLTINKNSKILANKQYLLRFLNTPATISHNNRMFKTPQSPIVYGANYIYISEHTVTKIINYEDNPEAEFDIVHEIAMQIYAQRLKNKCDIYVPKIINYGKVILPETAVREFRIPYNHTCFFYVTMEKINDNPLEYIATNAPNSVCEAVINKANDANRCLVANHFYHNDFHANNVLVDDDQNLTLLDYGNATLHEEGYAKAADGNEVFGANKINIKCKNKGGRGKSRGRGRSKGKRKTKKTLIHKKQN